MNKNENISDFCVNDLHGYCKWDSCECKCHKRLILICGDRNWQNKDKIKEFLMELKLKCNNFKVINGACRGADKMSSQVCKELNIVCQEVPANWATYGKVAGPRRNKMMLDLKPDLVIAFHNDIENSKGTKDCVREAKKRNIEVKLYGDSNE